MNINETLIFKLTILLSVMTSLVSLLWSVPASLGFLIGGLAGSFVFRILSLDIKALLKRQGTNLSGHIWKGYLRRYALNGITLIVALVNPYVSFPTTLIGLLFPKLLILFLSVTRRNKSAI